MNSRKSQVNAYPASTPSNRAALLFVHGAYVNSSCWTFNFIPFFQRHGYDCFTVDLAGHGHFDVVVVSVSGGVVALAEHLLVPLVRPRRVEEAV